MWLLASPTADMARHGPSAVICPQVLQDSSSDVDCELIRAMRVGATGWDVNKWDAVPEPWSIFWTSQPWW